MTTRTVSPGRRHRIADIFALAAAVLVAAMLLVACVSPAPPASPAPASPAPSLPPAPSTTAAPTTITSRDAAAAAVIATDPRFARIGEKRLDRIGACCFWTSTATATGYDVVIEIGWGDCPAGCINRHRWFYSVTTDGTIHLDREDGPPVAAGVPGPVDGTAGIVGLRGVASAGPVCPVVSPNDPNCADRPVAGATVHVFDATGLEVATLETDLTGAFVVALPPGQYRVQADPVAGLMGTAPPVDVAVGAGQALVQLTYDTGIR